MDKSVKTLKCMTKSHNVNIFSFFRLLSLNKKCPFNKEIIVIGTSMGIICIYSIKRA